MPGRLKRWTPSAQVQDEDLGAGALRGKQEKGFSPSIVRALVKGLVGKGRLKMRPAVVNELLNLAEWLSAWPEGEQELASTVPLVLRKARRGHSGCVLRWQAELIMKNEQFKAFPFGKSFDRRSTALRPLLTSLLPELGRVATMAQEYHVGCGDDCKRRSRVPAPEHLATLEMACTRSELRYEILAYFHDIAASRVRRLWH